MKKTILAILTTLSLASCRALILEDRMPCPSFLFFDIQNATQFEDYKRVYISALDYHSGELYTADTTVLSYIQEHAFYLKVPKSDATRGFGILGFRDLSIRNSTQLLIDEGNNGEPLYRFDYTVSSRDESATVPVELVKDHAKVRVIFRNYDSFTGAAGRFPFFILVKGNTCGIDGLSGRPIPGPFRYRPEEDAAGEFQFIVPRQADHSLVMELWAKEGQYQEKGLIRTFPLWDMFRQAVALSWEAKNLPDIELKIDYRESTCKVIIQDWSEKNSFDLEF